jgi:histidyl-tRNA synthetase
LHDALPALKVELNLGGGSFKAQMKRADKSGAICALVLGEQEIAAGGIGVKPLRRDAPQHQVARGSLVAALANELMEPADAD